jgi:hypothetical protein
MNTTWTAAKAAVAAKISGRFAVVMTVSANENAAVKIVISPRRFGILCTTYRTTIEVTGSSDDSIVLNIDVAIIICSSR